MKNKTDLTAAVNALPEFESREIGLKVAPPPDLDPEDTDGAMYEVVPDHWTAITEVGSHDPITFASNRYRLVQFKESCLPLISRQPETMTGRIAYNQGFLVMDIFPNDDESNLPDGYKIGLSAYNSVDRTSALMIRFNVTDGSRVIAFPKNVASFYQAHIGAAKQKQDTYVEMIGKIKEFWPVVINDMSKVEVTPELFDSVTAEFKCDPRIKKELAAAVGSGTKYNLWELILDVYDKMGTKYSKSDIHLRKRRDEFMDSVISWAQMLKIMG